MKSIEITKIKSKVEELIAEASFNLPLDIKEGVKRFREKETESSARQVLDLILENSLVAPVEKLLLCQDCGNTYIDLKIGPGICIEDSGNLHRGLNDAVAKSYNKNFLRKSIVGNPLYERVNTGNNTPAFISTRFGNEPGLEISVSLKGGGSENCSYLSMENPSIGQDRIISLVLELVRANVTKCCPPSHHRYRHR